jgi:protein involved in polysaccharide export with SLBB domain
MLMTKLSMAGVVVSTAVGLFTAGVLSQTRAGSDPAHPTSPGAKAGGAGARFNRLPAQFANRPDTKKKAANLAALKPGYVVEPPDLIRVEVAAALPGKPITGERLVRPDGKVSLGFYGDVYVAGLSTDEIKERVIDHLRKHLSDEALGLLKPVPGADRAEPVAPRDSLGVFVDVLAYNSKFYYVQGGVAAPGKIPVTGNDTVLDAINYAGGLTSAPGQATVTLVRPAPPGACCEQVLPVNLHAIVNRGDPATNHPLMPGDRVVVSRTVPLAADGPPGPARPVTILATGQGIDSLGPPSEQEVWSEVLASGKALPPIQEVARGNARIRVEKVGNHADPCKSYPLAGPCVLLHGHYRCTVEIDEPGGRRVLSAPVNRHVLSPCTEPDHPHASPGGPPVDLNTAPAPAPAAGAALERRVSEIERKLDRVIELLEKGGARPAPGG